MQFLIRKYTLSIIIGTCLPIFTNSADANASCQSKARLFYANGIFNSYETAKESWINLNAAVIEAQLSPRLTHDTSPNIAYNTNQPVLLQIAEVLDQKIEDIEKIDRDVDSGDMFRILNRRTTKDAKLFGILARRVDTLLRQNINEQKEKDIALQIANYRKTLESGVHALVVSHSQGNFFSNEAYEKVMFSEDYKSFKGIMLMLAIATPSDKVADTRFKRYQLLENRLAKISPFIYYTLEEDLIIKWVPDKLPANASDPATVGLGHGFVDNYLARANRTALLDMIQASLNELSSDSESAEQTSAFIDGIQSHHRMGPSPLADDPMLEMNRANIHKQVGYISKDMIPLWHWLHQHTFRPEKYDHGQCLAGLALIDTFLVEKECTKQATFAKSWFDDCPTLALKAAEEDLPEAEYSYCISFDGSTHVMRGKKRDAQPLIFNQNPECWANSTANWAYSSDLVGFLDWPRIEKGKQFLLSMIDP